MVQTPNENIKEIDLLKKEIEFLKNELKQLKENCIYKIKVEDLKPKDLGVQGIIIDECIRLEKNQYQYGPYRHYEQGKYLIVYNGDSLLNGEFDVIDNQFKKPFPLTFIYKTQKKICYEVIIPPDLKSGVEFRVCNKQPTFLIVKNIEVFRYNI